MISYEKKELLKQSDTSTVWKVQLSNDGSEAVLKEYQGSFPASLYQRLREIRQSNLAAVLDAWKTEDGFCVLESYAAGVPLEDLLEGGKQFSQKESLSIAIQLCHALGTLHDRGIIYRDLKPSNIILGAQGHITLIDFNAARLFSSAREKDTRYLGTEGYAAPEQYGYTQTDARADIYALGITLKRILPGKSKMSHIIRKSTQFDPERRYRTIKQVEKKLQCLESHVRGWVAVGCAVVFVCIAGIILLQGKGETRQLHLRYAVNAVEMMNGNFAQDGEGILNLWQAEPVLIDGVKEMYEYPNDYQEIVGQYPDVKFASEASGALDLSCLLFTEADGVKVAENPRISLRFKNMYIKGAGSVWSGIQSSYSGKLGVFDYYSEVKLQFDTVSVEEMVTNSPYASFQIQLAGAVITGEKPSIEVVLEADNLEKNEFTILIQLKN